MPTFLPTAFHFLAASCCLLHSVNPEESPSAPAIAKYFNTKGRYEEVNPRLAADPLAANRSVLRLPSAQCREIHLTAVVRHGTRYPTGKDIGQMHELSDLVKNNASGEEGWLRELRDRWTMWYTEDMDGRLVRKGVDDLRHLAVRLSKLFPALVSEGNLRGGLITFISSSTHRCINSTLSFQAGLTELWAIKDQKIDYAVNDTLMRFFDRCARFVQEVSNNPAAVAEVSKFKEGPEMRRVQEKVADRLGVPHGLITQEMATAAFHLCAYEFAIRTVDSPWCQLLDEDDAKVLEYASDLREFWKRGYGHDINSRSSCLLLRDVFGRLSKAADEIESGRRVTEAAAVQVGHADTLLPLLTLLGFFKDRDALTSTGYAEQARRAFRTSWVMPYAANFLLVLYDCGEGDLRLLPLLNEKLVTFPGLEDQRDSVPLYRAVREHYRDLLRNCDYEAECRPLDRPAEV